MRDDSLTLPAPAGRGEGDYDGLSSTRASGQALAMRNTRDAVAPLSARMRGEGAGGVFLPKRHGLLP